MRDVLDAARAARPDREVACMAFRTLEDGREIARMGPDADLLGIPADGPFPARLRPKDVLVLSVTVTETTFEAVRIVTHVLVARTRRPSPDTSSPSSTQSTKRGG